MSLWGLRVALAIFALANAGLLAATAYDRLGPQHGRLAIESCRLDIDPNADGLWEMVSGDGAPITLRVAGLYMPKGDPRPQATQLADFGFSVDPEARQPAAMTAYVALEAHGPAVEAYAAQQDAAAPRPLVVRDVARGPDLLAGRYGGADGIALARGIADIAVSDGAVRLVPRLRVMRLHAGRAERQRLAERVRERGEPCRSEMLVEIAFGARYLPRLDGLRPLERVEGAAQ